MRPSPAWPRSTHGSAACATSRPRPSLAAADRLDPVAYRRAEHVVTENARVEATVAALAAGDLAAVGRLFAESHASLRDRFEVSSPELDAMVEIAMAVPGVIAARMTGAGFGGCTINLVRPDAIEALAGGRRSRVPATDRPDPSCPPGPRHGGRRPSPDADGTRRRHIRPARLVFTPGRTHPLRRAHEP